MSRRSMLVAGVMSGTSADGVDVALCRISDSATGLPRLRVLGHRTFPYNRSVRSALLSAMDAKSAAVSDLSRLHWRLGQIYADAVERAATDMGVRVQLVGCHGQTVFHQSVATRYLGAPVRCTWQMGEPAAITERMRVPVVTDFRPADIAAGGQGAPLVPMLDWVMFRSARVGRVLQNLGGIGNMTAIPAGANAGDVIAFDTGPANMVIDAAMRRLFGKQYDRNGATASSGRVLGRVVETELQKRYFSLLPPKSCGREEFGEPYFEQFLRSCRTARGGNADVIATATALTAESVIRAYRSFVAAKISGKPVEYAVAGGGAKNSTLVAMLQSGLEPMGVRMRPMEELGVAAEAKEAVAFALLAWLTWHHRPGNIVTATGARRPVVLGKVCFA